MSEIDFQNGFLCGMATRGMMSSGFTYSRYIEVNCSDGFDISNAILNFTNGMTEHIETPMQTGMDSVYTEILDLSFFNTWVSEINDEVIII